jgi:RNA polymerase sigma-70 factor (ECF subfamily)
MQAEVVLQLIRALDTLPADQREAIRLRYFDSWTLERIAAHMNRSLTSVAGLLKRGLKSLRGKLSPTDCQPPDTKPSTGEPGP